MYTGMYQIQQLEQKSLYHSRVFSTPDRQHLENLTHEPQGDVLPPTLRFSRYLSNALSFRDISLCPRQNDICNLRALKP